MNAHVSGGALVAKAAVLSAIECVWHTVYKKLTHAGLDLLGK